MDIQAYVNEIRALYASGLTTEHSFRPALARLFASIDSAVTVINEPRQIAVGAPDFAFYRNDIAIGWCEAKDIGKDVRKFAAGDYSKEQKGRYTKGLPKLPSPCSLYDLTLCDLVSNEVIYEVRW